MNVLLLTNFYPPEIRSASHLMQELAEGLKAMGHNVTVVASIPPDVLIAKPIKKRLEGFSNENGVEVIRIKALPQFKVKFFIRGISQLTLPYLFFARMKKYIKFKKYDIVICYSPPLPLALVGRKAKKIYGAKFILNLQDIFPQNAIDLNILRNPLLIKFFEIIERRVYKSADIITVHSAGNKEYLLERKQLKEDKVCVIHNWIDANPYLKVNKNDFYRIKFGLDNKFIFLFAGIIGPSQGLELLIEVARRVKYYSEIRFLMVGEGKEKGKLLKMTENYTLDNVIFKPMVSKEEYITLLKEVDVGVVCLSNKNKTPVIPGKLLGYMAASLPVVAFLNNESDAHKIIREAKCGFSIVSDDCNRAAEIIIKIYKEKEMLNEYGKNGFRYVLNHYNKDICMKKLERLFY